MLSQRARSHDRNVVCVVKRSLSDTRRITSCVTTLKSPRSACARVDRYSNSHFDQFNRSHTGRSLISGSFYGRAKYQDLLV
jgi:hypothetical protein